MAKNKLSYDDKMAWKERLKQQAEEEEQRQFEKELEDDEDDYDEEGEKYYKRSDSKDLSFYLSRATTEDLKFLIKSLRKKKYYNLKDSDDPFEITRMAMLKASFAGLSEYITRFSDEEHIFVRGKNLISIKKAIEEELEKREADKTVIDKAIQDKLSQKD